MNWLYTAATNRSNDGENSKRMLLVRTDAIGDFVLFTPVLKHLRRFYRGHRIEMVLNEQALELATPCNYLDEVIPFNVKKYRRNLLYRVRFVRELRARNFAVAINPMFSREPVGDEILLCSGAREKIGLAGDLSNIDEQMKIVNDCAYSRLVRLDESAILEIEKNRLLVEDLTGLRIRPEEFVPELWVTKGDRAFARDLLERSGIRPFRDLVVVLFPGASFHSKTWPARDYARLADKVAEQFSAKIIISGSVQDEPYAITVASAMKTAPIILTGKTNLCQLAALLEFCDLYVGSDTGPLHMAVAMGTPTLCIMGGGHFGRFYPYGDLSKHRMVFRKMDCYGCNWRCIYPTVRCIEEISVEDVWGQTQQIVEEVVLLRKTRKESTAAAGKEMQA